MINIDIEKNIFKVKIPTNEKEFEYLQGESLIAIGSFLIAKEKKENRKISDKEILDLINYGRVFNLMVARTHKNQNSNKDS